LNSHSLGQVPAASEIAAALASRLARCTPEHTLRWRSVTPALSPSGQRTINSVIGSERARRAGGAVLLLLIGLCVAAVAGFAVWHLLPYGALERESAADRFLLWEAVMWMSGLALMFFGASAWFGSTDLYASHGDAYVNRTSDHIRLQLQAGAQGRGLFSDIPSVPWLMMGMGAGLALQAAILRAGGYAG
jgi:hypothetical protein